MGKPKKKKRRFRAVASPGSNADMEESPKRRSSDGSASASEDGADDGTEEAEAGAEGAEAPKESVGARRMKGEINVDEMQDLVRLHAKITSGDALEPAVFQSVVVSMAINLLKKDAKIQQMQKQIDDMEKKMMTMRMEIQKVTKTVNATAKDVEGEHTKEAQKQIIVKNLKNDVPVESFLEDLCTILDVNRSSFAHASRLSVNEEMKERLKQRGQSINPPVKIRCYEQSQALDVMRNLGKLQGTRHSSLRFGLFYPPHLKLEAREMEKLSYELRKTARNEKTRLSTSLRWQNDKLALFTKGNGDSQYKIYNV